MIKCKYSVYLLKSTVCNKTYIGYTNGDVKVRLKKHNESPTLGAKRTRRHRPWEIIFYVTGFEFERTALQYEYMAQHPPKRLRKRGNNGIANKIKIMKSLLHQEKICSTAPLNSELKLAIFFLKPEAYKLWNSF